MQEQFYVNTVERLLESGSLTADSKVLVVAGGANDRDSLLAAGMKDVVISNLDDRMDGEAFAPYGWMFEDAEKLTIGDGSFDVVITHQALHHCGSPHAALLELYRVASRAVLVFEPRDSVVARLGVKLGYGQQYELEAVAANDGTHGGVNNTEVPNYVFRWTEHEVDKTIRSAEPRYEPKIRYFYSLRGDLTARFHQSSQKVVRVRVHHRIAGAV